MKKITLLLICFASNFMFSHTINYDKNPLLQTDLGSRKVPGPGSGFSKPHPKTLLQTGYNKLRHIKRSVS